MTSKRLDSRIDTITVNDIMFRQSATIFRSLVLQPLIFIATQTGSITMDKLWAYCMDTFWSRFLT